MDKHKCMITIQTTLVRVDFVKCVGVDRFVDFCQCESGTRIKESINLSFSFVHKNQMVSKVKITNFFYRYIDFNFINFKKTHLKHFLLK